jgi:hypothetical protein
MPNSIVLDRIVPLEGYRGKDAYRGGATFGETVGDRRAICCDMKESEG